MTAHQKTQPAQEKSLRSRRNRILKKGIVSFSHQGSIRPCSVHELSETGALLRFDDETGLPTSFKLMIELDGMSVSCRVVRRIGNKIAVAFTGDIEFGNVVRRQVVQPSFEPTKILDSRARELHQIAANMGRSSEGRAGSVPESTNTDRNAPVRFGKLK